MYKSIIVIAFMFFSLNATNNIYENNYFNEIIKRSEVLLTSLMDFESRDAEKIVNDKTYASGILQQFKINVDEANRIIRLSKWVKKLSKKYSVHEISTLTKINDNNRCFNLVLMRDYNYFDYDDRFNMQKSIEMFYVVQEYWNPEFDIEKGARLHGGGFHVNTDNYYRMFLPFYLKHLKEYSF